MPIYPLLYSNCSINIRILSFKRVLWFLLVWIPYKYIYSFPPRKCILIAQILVFSSRIFFELFSELNSTKKSEFTANICAFGKLLGSRGRSY